MNTNTDASRSGYDPNCMLPRPHGHHWNPKPDGHGLGFGTECFGEPKPPTSLPQSGYTPCACRDCMNTTVSGDITSPELCSECADAGCDAWSSREGRSAFECQREDAYDA